MQNDIITIMCCDCNKILGTKPGKGQTGISHTYCDKCFIKVKKSIWEETHNVNPSGKHYHPWVSEGGKPIVFESMPYYGGFVFERKFECKSVQEAENICKELNG